MSNNNDYKAGQADAAANKDQKDRSSFENDDAHKKYVAGWHHQQEEERKKNAK